MSARTLLVVSALLCSTGSIVSAGNLRKTRAEPVRRIPRTNGEWNYVDHLPKKVVHVMPDTCCGTKSMAPIKAAVNSIEDKVDHLKKLVRVDASLPNYSSKEFWKGHVEHTEDAGLIMSDGKGNM
jgi:hypothetical protein